MCDKIYATTTCLFKYFIHSVVCLWQGHSFVQSEFSTECSLLLPLLIQVSSHFLRISSFLRHLHLTVTSILPSIFLSISCFRSQLLHEMWPIQLAFLLCSVSRIFLSPLTLCNTSSFSHNHCNWSSQSFSNIIFQTFEGIFSLLFELSKFQHHTKLCFKCSTLLVCF